MLITVCNPCHLVYNIFQARSCRAPPSTASSKSELLGSAKNKQTKHQQWHTAACRGIKVFNNSNSCVTQWGFSNALTSYRDSGGEPTDRVPPRRRLGDMAHSTPEPDKGKVGHSTWLSIILSFSRSSTTYCHPDSEHDATGTHEEPHQAMPPPSQAGAVHPDDSYRDADHAQVGVRLSNNDGLKESPLRRAITHLSTSVVSTVSSLIISPSSMYCLHVSLSTPPQILSTLGGRSILRTGSSD